MGDVVSIFKNLRLPKPPYIPSTCPACGELIEHERDGHRDDAERVHLLCAIPLAREESWEFERYDMRWTLSRSLAELLGRENVEPIIEAIGDEKRKPSQVFTALMTLQAMIRDPDAHINPFWLGAADAAVQACVARLRLFLRRTPKSA